ncbi:carboxymuconolactone decarboxylase family protein [Mycobacterium spongiae]|uniref:Peroxidase-related enzyme n=1 Tax=Mycobacterium spongiae TaxID=886343 RepID=A0A975JY64_9MYCO|nr:peroxidase-related enzyme [Mycobacterium spongiae]QUR67877.1 peroxidase-related enzyme [Mycobacterium spongiae]
MNTLPPVTEAAATPDQAAALSAVKQALGSVPNLTRAMANSPALLRGYLGFANSLDAGTLPRATRERLAIAIAQSNTCSYCLSAHTHAGQRVAGLSAEQVAAARKGDADDPKTAAILTFAVAVNEQRGQIDESELEAVRRAGVSDTEIAEVIGHVALNVLTNYFNNVAHTEIDFPLVSA